MNVPLVPSMDNKMRDPSFGLLPDFVGCAMVMGLPVGVVGILVGVEIFFRILAI